MIISEEGKSKSRTFVVSSIIKKLDKMNLNGEHSQQRDFIWEKYRQSNLISDVLQNNPLPELVFAEQIINNATIIWVIDGKQRCTTLQEFVGNKFAIGTNVTRYMITYSEPVKDEDGCIVRDDNGDVVYELKEFDIRKKRFKDLPDVLKEKLLDYAFNVVYYCNCSDEEIAYHIQRYNSGKPMNVAQKGMTFIGKRNSDAIRNILSMSFFVDGIGAYTPNQFTTSTMSRVVAESIMTTRFLGNWCKKYEDNCKFLEQNATADDFEAFKSLVTELEENVEYSVGKMFNDTDSFLWFGIYAQFKKVGLNCSDFNAFMKEINRGITRNNNGKIDKKVEMTGICAREIDGITLDELLRNPSTKDVNIVKTRIDFLTKLACDYFDIDISELITKVSDMPFDIVSIEKERELFVNIATYKDVSVEDSIIACNMVLSRYPKKSMEKDNISEFINWCNEEEYDSREYIEIMDEAEIIFNSYCDMRNVLNTKTLPVFLMLFNYTNKKDFEKWFDYYMFETDHNEIDLDCVYNNENIMGIYSKLNANLREYINREEEDNYGTEENY